MGKTGIGSGKTVQVPLFRRRQKPRTAVHELLSPDAEPGGNRLAEAVSYPDARLERMDY